MNDLRCGLEWLREDCAALRELDREGEYTERLEFIEEMLGYLLSNLASMAKLAGLRERLGLGLVQIERMTPPASLHAREGRPDDHRMKIDRLLYCSSPASSS